MRAALGATRRGGPARLIAAVPVGSADRLPSIRALADEVVCLSVPRYAKLARRLDGVLNGLADEPHVSNLPIGLFGASTGAAAAIQVAAHRRDIRALVSRGGRPDLAGVTALENVAAPTLLIVGGADTQVISLNRKALAALRGIAELVLVPHATHLFEEPDALEQVASMAGDWFARWLPPA